MNPFPETKWHFVYNLCDNTQLKLAFYLLKYVANEEGIKWPFHMSSDPKFLLSVYSMDLEKSYEPLFKRLTEEILDPIQLDLVNLIYEDNFEITMPELDSLDSMILDDLLELDK